MSIAGVLGRFAAAYVVFMVLAVVVLRLLDINSSSGVNIAVLIGSVMWSCMAFGTKNQRYFTAQEKSTVVWSMIGINLLIQVLLGGAALASAGKLGLGAFVFALLFVGVLHSLAIAYFVGAAGKNVAKQLQKQAAATELRAPPNPPT